MPTLRQKIEAALPYAVALKGNFHEALDWCSERLPDDPWETDDFDGAEWTWHTIEGDTRFQFKRETVAIEFKMLFG